MKNTSVYTLVILLMACLLPLNVAAKKKPDWVKQRPNDPAYYIGIGMTAKSGSEIDYKQGARSKALKEMCSEIQVTISSNSVLHQIENNFEFREEYESKVQTSVEQTLEGYEVLTWEDRKEYWVMTRLSKLKYEQRKKQKLDRVKMMATAYYDDAKKAVGQNDAYAALNYLAKAVISIKDHLEEDLTHRTVDGTYNVGTELFGAIQDVFRRLEIVPVQSVYQIQFSKDLQVPIGVNAQFKSDNGEMMPLRNLPLQFSFSKGEGVLTTETTTNRDGYAQIAVTRLISKRKTQEIVAGFDFSYVMNQEADEEIKKLLNVFFPRKLMPVGRISLEIQKSKAYLITEEKIFGELSGSGPFSNMIKTELNENFFTFTNNMEEAEFIVKIKSDFVAGDEKKGQGYSVFLVFADFSISIIDNATQTEIFTDGLNGIRGMRPGNFEYALKEARKQTLEQFHKQIEQRLEQVDM